MAEPLTTTETPPTSGQIQAPEQDDRDHYLDNDTILATLGMAPPLSGRPSEETQPSSADNPPVASAEDVPASSEPSASSEPPASSPPASGESPQALQQTLGDLTPLLAQTVAQAVSQTLAPVLERLGQKAPSETPPPQEPSIGDARALARRAAQATLGETAPEYLLTDYAQRLQRALAIEQFSGAKGWDTPEAQAKIESARDDWNRYDAMTRANASLAAEVRDLKARLDKPAPPDRAKVLDQFKPELVGYLQGVAGVDDSGRQVTDIALHRFPHLAKAAREGRMDAIVDQVHNLVPEEVDSDSWAPAVFAALARMENVARVFAGRDTPEKSSEGPPEAAPPASPPPTNPGQGSNGAMRSQSLEYVSDNEILASLRRPTT
jgi:hypothetical protein